MVAETLLKNLGINKTGSYSEDGDFIVDIANDIEFSKIYTLLDRSDSLEFLEDDSALTLQDADISYAYKDEFLLTLIADFEKDSYKLILTNMKDSEK